MKNLVYDSIVVKYNAEQLALKLKTNIKFPILVIDFESYHLVKGKFQGEDYQIDLNDKPFLLGVMVIRSYEELMSSKIENLDNYQYYLSWKRHDKKMKLLRKFANFLETSVEFHDIQTIVAAGKDMEQTLITFFEKHELMKPLKIKIYDIYDLIEQSSNKVVNFGLYDQSDNNIKKQITHEILKLMPDVNYDLLESENENKVLWNDMWRQLDRLYSIDNRFRDVNLRAFQHEIQPRVLQKNRDDIIISILVLRFIFEIVKK